MRIFKKKNNPVSNARKSITTKLITYLVPMLVISITVILVFLSYMAERNIVKVTKYALIEDARANAGEFGGEFQKTLASFDAVLDSIDSVDLRTTEEIERYIKPTLNVSKDAEIGIYLGFSDGSTIFANGFKIDPSLKATDRAWYKEGINRDKFDFGEPYLDTITGKPVVTVSRKFSLKDGRNGVAGADILLTSLVERIDSMKPMGSGNSIIMSQKAILAHYNHDMNGKMFEEVASDAFLKKLVEIGKNNDDKIYEVKDGDGQKLLVKAEVIPGTDMKLFSFVRKKDVLSELTSFKIIAYSSTTVVYILVILAMLYLINKLITKPVRGLTDKILMVTDGDLTVEFTAKADDEIGIMRKHLGEYVSFMKSTVSTIKGVSEELHREADGSAEVVEILNKEASEQFNAMEQVRGTMENVSDSVTEMANNASDLAGSVTEVTAESKRVADIMEVLVSKARGGKNDMEVVKEKMNSVAVSMDEMSAMVVTMEESARKINEIVDMIGAIASQTNLLSLNASIEAARAGEAGKGFAVVADEIGKLATHSANSTTEIASIIKDITTQISMLAIKSDENVRELTDSKQSIEQAGVVFEDIFTDIEGTNNTIDEVIIRMSNMDEIATSVAAISEEQSASIEEVTAAAETMLMSTEKVANESEQVASSSMTIKTASETIYDLMELFRI